MEAPTPESLLNKVAGISLTMLTKKRPRRMSFPVNYAKILRMLFL